MSGQLSSPPQAPPLISPGAARLLNVRSIQSSSCLLSVALNSCSMDQSRLSTSNEPCRPTQVATSGTAAPLNDPKYNIASLSGDMDEGLGTRSWNKPQIEYLQSSLAITSASDARAHISDPLYHSMLDRINGLHETLALSSADSDSLASDIPSRVLPGTILATKRVPFDAIVLDPSTNASEPTLNRLGTQNLTRNAQDYSSLAIEYQRTIPVGLWPETWQGILKFLDFKSDQYKAILPYFRQSIPTPKYNGKLRHSDDFAVRGPSVVQKQVRLSHRTLDLSTPPRTPNKVLTTQDQGCQKLSGRAQGNVKNAMVLQNSPAFRASSDNPASLSLHIFGIPGVQIEQSGSGNVHGNGRKFLDAGTSRTTPISRICNPQPPSMHTWMQFSGPKEGNGCKHQKRSYFRLQRRRRPCLTKPKDTTYPGGKTGPRDLSVSPTSLRGIHNREGSHKKPNILHVGVATSIPVDTGAGSVPHMRAMLPKQPPRPKNNSAMTGGRYPLGNSQNLLVADTGSLDTDSHVSVPLIIPKKTRAEQGELSGGNGVVEQLGAIQSLDGSCNSDIKLFEVATEESEILAESTAKLDEMQMIVSEVAVINKGSSTTDLKVHVTGSESAHKLTAAQVSCLNIPAADNIDCIQDSTGSNTVPQEKMAKESTTYAGVVMASIKAPLKSVEILIAGSEAVVERSEPGSSQGRLRGRRKWRAIMDSDY